MKRGTIIFDIDGVLLDFYTPFLNWYNQNHGTSFVVSDLKRYDIASELNIDQKTIVDFHDEDICGALPLVDPESNPSNVLQQLRSMGYRIVFNTDWPTQHIEKREKNLKDHGLIYDAIHYGEKGSLFTRYDDIVVILEDNPKWIRFYLTHGTYIAVPIRDYLQEELVTKRRRVLLYNGFRDFFSLFFHNN